VPVVFGNSRTTKPVSLNQRYPKSHRRSLLRSALWICAACCFIGITHVAQAQEKIDIDSNLAIPVSGLPTKVDTLFVTGGGPFLIRPFIVSSSLNISISDRALRKDEFSLVSNLGYVSFRNVDPDSAFSFVATYQYVPLQLQSEYHLWEKVDRSDTNELAADLNLPKAKTGLRSSGSITRGVLTGTDRDASVESGLRLEVEGEITEGISVRAVLTDEDTPLLPEGTTSRLEQFDQVFIEFASSKGKIALGDLDVTMPEGEFSRVKRRVQGVSLHSSDLAFSSAIVPNVSFQATGATSRGKFKSHFVSILEGVQGPYRLEGNASERFILILPGTERVYVDGLLLERGQTSDYIIDYTTAEITFMPSRMVASSNRVRVEFEYTTNQFSRSFLGGEASVGLGRGIRGPLFEFGVTALRESDGESFAEELGFSSADSLILSQSGDQLIFASSANEVVFDPEALYTQYFQVIGFDGRNAFEVVSRPPREEELVYRVIFTRVGAGKGSYRRQGSLADASLSNGIAYLYVGMGQGEYDAVRPLTPPRTKEIIDLRIRSKALPFGFITGEWAGSRNDVNTLSAFDTEDDNGSATSVHFESLPLILGRYAFTGRADFSHRSKYFTTFDRTRSIEFEREWNIRTINTDPVQNLRVGQSEQQSGAEIEFRRADSSHVEVGFDAISLGHSLEAARQRLSFRLAENRMPELSLRGRRVQSTDLVANSGSGWHNLVSRITKTRMGAFLKPYLEWETERYSGTQVGVELAAGANASLDYDEIRAGSHFGNENSQVSIFLEQRFEKDDAINESGKSIQTVQAKWSFRNDEGMKNNLSAGLRRIHSKFDLTGEGANKSSGQNTLLLGWDGEWSPGVQNRLSWLYQVQSEQTSRLQEIYIRTGQERGEYIWDDLNGDNIIQIEEFIPETTPSEGEYALTYFPSDSLEFVTSLTASARFRRTGGGSGNRLSRIGLGTAVEVSEKSKDPDRNHIYFLQLGTFRSSDFTVNGRLRISQEFRILPTNRTYDFDVSGSEIWAFTDLASGEQRLRTSEWNGVFGYRPSVVWTLMTRITRRIDQSEAGFASRSYDINGLELSPSVSFRPQSNWIISGGAQFADRTERNQGTSARAMQFPVSVQYHTTTKLTTRAKIEVASVKLNGASVGLQTFQLTEGRGAGTSWLWGLSLNARFTEVLTANFGYDGRKPNRGNTIHTGRIQFVARF
jgi:hypothetical protein